MWPSEFGARDLVVTGGQPIAIVGPLMLHTMSSNSRTSPRNFHTILKNEPFNGVVDGGIWRIACSASIMRYITIPTMQKLFTRDRCRASLCRTRRHEVSFGVMKLS